MTTQTIARTAATAAWLLVCVGLADVCRAQDREQTVKLQLEAGGRTASIYTPSRMIGQGKEFQFDGGQGQVTLGGRKVVVAAVWTGESRTFGCDCNGDGKIDASEIVRVDPRTPMARFRIKAPADTGLTDQAIRFFDLTVAVQTGRVRSVKGRYMVDGAMAGRLADGHDVLLFDDNLDGQYTQDGKDAICIEPSAAAVPLGKCHQVGKYQYGLVIGPGGQEATFTRQDDLPLGLVDVPIRPGLIRCFVLTDPNAGRAYDLRVNEQAGIPAGAYVLSYAVLASGKGIVVAEPTVKSLTYTVDANMINVLRFGGKIELVFKAGYEAKDKQVRIDKTMAVYGEGGEKYNLDFAGVHAMGLPTVGFVNGRTTLSTSRMTYDNEGSRLMDFREWIPNGLSRTTGQITLTTDLPILGKAVGSVLLSDVLDGKQMAQGEPRKPSVMTKKIPANIRLGALPPDPKPKPVPTPVYRPEPTSKPTPTTRPRSEDPEYEASRLLEIAKAYMKQDRKKLGLEKLNIIVKEYSQTAACKEAKSILLDIELEKEGL